MQKNQHRRSSILYRDRDGRPELNEDPWTRLSLYQSRDLIAERYHERHGRILNDGKSREIASSLIQGDQYFASARTSGNLARPLLLYYGVLSLSRALILFADTSAREATLLQGHGLKTVGWPSILSGETKAKGIPDLSMMFQGGTFTHLSSVTSNAQWTQVLWTSDMPQMGASTELSGHIGWLAKGTEKIRHGSTVTFGDVIKRIPDLAYMYEEVFGEPAVCFPALITAIRGPFNMGPNVPAKLREVQISVLRNKLDLPNDEILIETLGLDHFKAMPRRVKDPVQFAARPESTETISQILPPIRINRHWADYVVSPFPNGDKLSSISNLFLAAYAIGMLVRYNPTTWQGISSIGIGDRAFPLLRAAMSLVERQFPIEIADSFDRNVKVDKVYDLPSTLWSQNSRQLSDNNPRHCPYTEV